MLFALAVLVIGGTVLCAGPVQSFVLNFNETGIRTTTDSLLCPNTIYTFQCEISGDVLQLISLESDGSDVNIFNVFSTNADEGTTSSQSEFNFTAFYSVNGSLAATAVMKASTALSSIAIECRDLSDGNSSSLSTVVKDPLDAPVLVDQTCFSYDDSVTFIKLTWEPVECAQLYVLDASFLGEKARTETSFETFIEASYNFPTTNFSGSLFADGGSALTFFQDCLISFGPNGTTPPTPPVTSSPTPGDVACYIANTTEIRVRTDTEIHYTLTFINFPDGGTAYYETSDGRVDITVVDGVGEIEIDSTVTVYVLFEDETVSCSQTLQEPLVSGENALSLWRLIAILLLVALCCLVCAFAIVIITKCVVRKSKVANQGKLRDNVDLAPDESEMKTVPRGSDM